MNLLALETATEACSVALWCDGEVRQRFELAPRRHAELVLPWAEALLAEAGLSRSALDLIAVGRGPGAFTGVRLGISLAQGIALALDIPVVAVSTLATLAMRASATDGQRVLAAIDARMGELYWAGFEFDDGAPRALLRERITAPAQVQVEGMGWHGVGSGFGAGEDALVRQLGAQLAAVDADALPQAADLARLAVRAHAAGLAQPADRIEPAYLRDNVALTLAEQAAARGTPAE
ncbi:tRNA (adenosine(37)-N6)-threonylcarbamoyltransferase complex dimerization subunit type 1 TsaB [Luteimonas sp. e5]